MQASGEVFCYFKKSKIRAEYVGFYRKFVIILDNHFTMKKTEKHGKRLERKNTEGNFENSFY